MAGTVLVGGEADDCHVFELLQELQAVVHIGCCVFHIANLNCLSSVMLLFNHNLECYCQSRLVLAGRVALLLPRATTSLIVWTTRLKSMWASGPTPPQGNHKGPEGSRHRSTTAHILFNLDRKSTRLNSSHANISYAVFCLQ